jgi:DNA-binding NarL/FixJ family response regulator
VILPVIFSAASLILCGFFFVYFRAWLGNRMGKDEKLARYREEVNRLIVAIDAATDRDAAIAEDRIQTLKNLIVEADEKITLMRREQEKQKSQRALHGPASYAALGRSRLPVETAASREAAEPVPAGGTVPSGTAPEAGEGKRQSGAVETPPESRSFAEEVAELVSQGLSAELIAQKLGASISEVDLAMRIRGGHPSEDRFF